MTRALAPRDKPAPNSPGRSPEGGSQRGAAQPPSPETELPRSWAALIGVLAVLAALGAGHLAAGLVSPLSSPYLAVGEATIRATPEWLKEFAIRSFGTGDKTALLVGMAIVIALVAAAAGLVARRRQAPGVTVLAVLALLAVVSVVTGPTFAPGDLFAPAAALAAGVGVFAVLHPRARRVVHLVGRRRAGGTGRISRRELITAAATVAGGAAVAGLGGTLLAGRTDVEASRATVGPLRPAAPAPPIPAGAAFPADGTPGFITSAADFYRIDTALVVPRIAAADWSLRIHGMVDRELRLNYADLRARRLVEQTVTLCCVSNEVGGQYISTANFLGVPLRELLLEAGVARGAEQIAGTSADGWTCGTPVHVVLEPDRGAMLAIGMNGQPLRTEHGFPVRMIVPGLYGYVSATKWLIDLELTTFSAFSSYWEGHGWAQQAPIKTESRIDRPRDRGQLRAGRVVVAGTAWAQHTGVDGVEVRVDGGPWQPAQLATEVNVDTWRMWRAEFTLAPGQHVLACRATDRDGYTQTEQVVDPIPDGATGYHTVHCTAVPAV